LLGYDRFVVFRLRAAALSRHALEEADEPPQEPALPARETVSARRLLLTSGYVGKEGVPSDLPFVPKPWRVDQVARAVGLRSY
jgi:hypothetical protein